MKKIDHSAEALATPKSQVPTVVEHYLGSKIGYDLQKVLQRHTADLIQKYFVKPTPKSSKIHKPTIDLEQKYEKSASEIHKFKREQAERQKMPKYIIKSIDKAALKGYDQKMLGLKRLQGFLELLLLSAYQGCLFEAPSVEWNSCEQWGGSHIPDLSVSSTSLHLRLLESGVVYLEFLVHHRDQFPQDQKFHHSLA
ncbi:hypothetical protein Tco_0673796 [Tanacetum coccineum]